MGTYQRLQHYDGNLYGKIAYNGIEYDNELEDTMIMASPGGMASNTGHWTKGFYGVGGGTNWDFYAGQGYSYPYGEYGNLYNTGEKALNQLGSLPNPPDTKFYNRQSPPKFDDNNIEFIENFSFGGNSTNTEKPVKLRVAKNFFAIFFILLLVYITFSFWTDTGTKFIQNVFHSGEDFTWQTGIIYSIVLTGITFIAASFVGDLNLIIGESNS